MIPSYYPGLDETCYKEVLENGLTVAVVKRPGFTKRLAYFVTDYGAIHTDFTLEGKEYHAPAGVAHYLEHKLFDMPGGRDVSYHVTHLNQFFQRIIRTIRLSKICLRKGSGMI